MRLKIKDIHKALEIANKIYESGIAEFSIPDFYIPIKLNQVNDPLFPLQFQMHNTGQVIDGIAGVNDIDVNALEAWNINLGDNITVAVFDQGMENHEDFGNRLIGGNTPATNGNGTPLVNNATHGMNCAGVIGASDDNLGLRGVAPNVNFLSVNIFAGGTTPGDIADGIQWAMDNGADVLSNSWSFSFAPCGFTNIDIENALQNAVDNGRNGVGAVVIFSSGNTGGCVNYPASNNNVISVGAVDNRGNLFTYSSRGPELDLVAPSGETNYLGNIRTTDRMANAGRLTGNYEPSFGGTSASCPVVAGVAALVLSVNPNLTQLEVRNILTSTATDMGVAGFDNNFGSGRVNAFAAVQAAQQSNNSIIGSYYVCSNTSYNLQSGIATSWQVSSNLLIINSTDTSITVKPKYYYGSAGWITANLNSGFNITKNVQVNNFRLDNSNFSVRDSYYNSLNGSGTISDPYLISNGNEYIISMYSINSHLINYTTMPSGWTTYSYGVFEIAFTPNNMNYANTYQVDIDYTDVCSNGVHSIYFKYSNYYGGFYSVSPNPASEILTVGYKLSNNENINSNLAKLNSEYRLYDFQFNLILKGNLHKLTNNIDISFLSKGLYFIKIYTKEDVETHQIIII